MNGWMIGIFDSGSGGLSVLHALRARAPSVDVVYFGDLGNAPYGPRSQDELAGFVRKGMDILTEKGATEIIAACNSISFSVLAGAAGHDRLIEMTRPAARMMRKYAGARVLLLATQATVDSGIYREVLWSIVALDELPVPNLASAIERGKPEDTIASIVRSALEGRKGKQYDKVLLGCTHYPLAHDIIEREVRAVIGDAELVDPADAVAEEAKQRFKCTGSGITEFVISKDSHEFRNRIAPMFLEGTCTLDVLS